MLLKIEILAIIFLSFFVICLTLLLSFKDLKSQEKPTPFECGFFRKSNFWTPFSIHFFVSAIIFLIFDIELVVLFPYLIGTHWKLDILAMTAAYLFLLFLSFGFFLEWSNKYLEWRR